jgi:hypothetical protein
MLVNLRCYDKFTWEELPMKPFKLIASYLNCCDIKSLYQVCKMIATKVIQEIYYIAIYPDENLSMSYFEKLYKTRVKYSSFLFPRLRIKVSPKYPWNICDPLPGLKIASSDLNPSIENEVFHGLYPYSPLQQQNTRVPVRWWQSKYIKIIVSSSRFLDNLDLSEFPFLEELVLEFKYRALPPEESDQCQRLYSRVSQRLYSRVSKHNFLFPGGRGWLHIEDDPVIRILW